MNTPVLHAAHTEAYRADFTAFDATINGAQPPLLKDLRGQAIDTFSTFGFPTRRMEEWRSTDVEPIAEGRFTRRAAAGAIEASQVEPHLYAGCLALVFVDGHFAPEFSTVAQLPQGVYAGSLASALKDQPDRVLSHLGKHAYFEHPAQAFVALNSAFIADGAFVEVQRNQVFETPIQLLYLSSGKAGDATASYPRNLLVAGENSQMTVIESFVSLGEGQHFTCAVTEIVCGDASVVDHYKVQKENRSAFHVAALYLYQGKDTHFDSHTVTHGGALVRNDAVANLDAEGISSTLNGLYVVEGNQHVDNHMLVEHAKANGYSHELYKGILDGNAETVFNGRIHVHKGAQKTDAVQRNQNLLLSRNATAHSNPQLEIFADDVRCTHGSTVGQLDEEAIFYLRSRGIGQDAAKSILTYAFAADIVERIKVQAVREDLEAFLFDRLPEGDIVRQSALT